MTVDAAVVALALHPFRELPSSPGFEKVERDGLLFVFHSYPTAQLVEPLDVEASDVPSAIATARRTARERGVGCAGATFGDAGINLFGGAVLPRSWTWRLPPADEDTVGRSRRARLACFDRPGRKNVHAYSRQTRLLAPRRSTRLCRRSRTAYEQPLGVRYGIEAQLGLRRGGRASRARPFNRSPFSCRDRRSCGRAAGLRWLRLPVLRRCFRGWLRPRRRSGSGSRPRCARSPPAARRPRRR